MANTEGEGATKSIGNQYNGALTPSRWNIFQTRHSNHHHLRLALLRRGQLQLQNFPFFSIESLSPWLKVTENALFQQRLKIWSPVFTFQFVGRICLFLSAIMVPLGATIVLLSSNAKEIRVNYGEECISSRNYLRLLRRTCVFCTGGHNPNCVKEVEIPQNMKTPVYVYYELENFKQNHRMLVRSVDNQQLHGKIFKEEENKFVPIQPSDSCYPYAVDPDGAYYFPCGAMANIMFDDDFAIKTEKGDDVHLRKEGIAHSIFKKYKFQNPPEVSKKNYDHKKIFIRNFSKPRDWSREVWDTWWENGGLENEDFINWMVPSASSKKLRKLYAVIDSVPDCPPGILCKGNYTIQIEYRFDADGFDGKKSIILATTSFFGSRNLFTPWVSIILGLLQALMGFLFLQWKEDLDLGLTSGNEYFILKFLLQFQEPYQMITPEWNRDINMEAPRQRIYNYRRLETNNRVTFDIPETETFFRNEQPPQSQSVITLKSTFEGL